jgi:hypothetical protein
MSLRLPEHFVALLNRAIYESFEIKNQHLPASRTAIVLGTFPFDEYIKMLPALFAHNKH